MSEKLKNLTIARNNSYVLETTNISDVPEYLVRHISNFQHGHLNVEVLNTVEYPIDEMVSTFREGDMHLLFVDQTGVVIQKWLFTNVKLKKEKLTLGYLSYYTSEDDDTKHTIQLHFTYDELKRIG